MKIWFNRWFTAVLHYIEMVRENPDQRKFIIYGSHSNKDALYLQYCDFAFIEPDIRGDDYIAYCLDFCKRNRIQIFIPHKENTLISKHLPEFEDIGVKVLVCPNAELMEMLENKAAAYDAFLKLEKASKPIFDIPDYDVVNNVYDFKQAYKMLKEKGHNVCFKPVIGEGASGFRIVQDNIDSIEQLFRWGGVRIPYRYACEILNQEAVFPDLMVLEYLEEREYSIDCLASQDKLYAAIPRMKGDGRVREIIESRELIQLAQKFHQEFKLPYAFNIQIKYNRGIPKLLEINPRMSGGLHISCLSGINIPYLAIKILLGETIGNLKPRFGIRASHIEKELIIGDRHHNKTNPRFCPLREDNRLPQ